MSDDDTRIVPRVPPHDDTRQADSADTAPVLVRRRSSEPASFTVSRALPPQAPPVNDIALLEFRPPEVPSGQTVRYRVRSDIEITEVPDFDADATVDRARRTADVPTLLAEHTARTRRWRRAALLTVFGVTVLAVAVAAVGIWWLSTIAG